MYMAYQMDSGDIIKQQSLSIDSNDDYQSLSQKLSILGTELLDQVLEDLLKGIIVKIPQDQTLVTYAYTIKHEDERISFHQSSMAIINRIRGLSPEPGAYAYLKNELIKFYKAKISDIIDSNEIPGTVLETKKRLIIKSLDSAVEILEIQAPGKKQMNVKDFLNGQTIIHKGDVFIEGKN